MRRVLLTIALFGLIAGAVQAQTIRIMGYGGSDPAIVQRLLDEVIGEQLAAEGITVQYEPIETDYNQVLTNALSAGTAADVFYIPGETAPGIIATGKVLPITDLVALVYPEDLQVFRHSEELPLRQFHRPARRPRRRAPLSLRRRLFLARRRLVAELTLPRRPRPCFLRRALRH